MNMELSFYDQERGFQIADMCSAMADALTKDGMEIMSSDILEAFNAALKENHIGNFSDYVREGMLLLMFADFSAEIAKYLGCQASANDRPTFAWFDDFLYFKRVCTQIMRVIDQWFNSQISADPYQLFEGKS